jgi:hypothetical protein
VEYKYKYEMHSTLTSFDNPLTIMEYLSIIKDIFIVPLNMLQKKAIFETFQVLIVMNKTFQIP